MFTRFQKLRTLATLFRALGGLTPLACCGCFDAMIAWVPASNEQPPASRTSDEPLTTRPALLPGAPPQEVENGSTPEGSQARRAEVRGTPEAAAPSAEQATAPSSEGQNATPAPGQPPSGAGPGGQTSLASPPAATGVQLHLKTGVALPQTGPNGTLMGFSVDYDVLAGMQTAQARYGKFLWIIEDARGQQVVCPFGPLREKGNLVVLKDGWRPEYGPFRCHIVVEHQGQRQVVSNVARLQ